MKEFDKHYQGTDPIEDQKKIYRKKVELKEKQALKEKDVMDVFGHGIKTYLRTLRFIMYAVISLIVLHIPTYYIYNQGGEYKDQADYGELRFMLGNLGQRKAICNN